MSHVSYYHPGVQNCKALPVYVTNASSIGGGGGGGSSGIELTGYTVLCDSANPSIYYLAWRSVNEDGTGTVQRYLTMPAGTETAGALPVTAVVCGDSSQVIEECFVNKLVSPDDYYKKLIVMNGATVSAVIVIDQQTNAVVGSLPAGAIPCQTAAEQLESVVLCDDVNGDGSLIVPFVRVVSVNADTGGVTNVGDYTADYSAPYSPTNPAVCADSIETVPYRQQHAVYLCDDVNGDGSLIVRFVRVVSMDADTGIVSPLGDYTPDYSASYSPTNPIACDSIPDDAPYRQQHAVALCDDVNGDGSLIVPFVRVVSVDADTGVVTTVGQYTSDYSAPYSPTNPISCGGVAGDTLYRQQYAVTLCDDVNGDGSLIVPFVRVVGVDTDTGVVMIVGQYTPDYSASYSPTNPVACGSIGNDVFYRQQRIALQGVGLWSRPSMVVRVTVTVVAVGNIANPPTVSCNSGTSPLFTGTSETWESPDGNFLSDTFSVSTKVGDIILIAYTEAYV